MHESIIPEKTKRILHDNKKETKAPNTRVKYAEMYADMIKSLVEYQDMSDEKALLEKMNDDKVQFWSPLPYESPQYYKYFLYYMQLPADIRTKRNVGLILHAEDTNVNIYDVIEEYGGDFSLRVPKYQTMLRAAKKYHWEIRAKLYDDYNAAQVLTEIEVVQRNKIAALRNSSLAIATLSNDVAIELLTKATQRLRTMELEELNARDVAAFIRSAGSLASDSMAIAEKTLALSEVLELVTELEELEEEQMRILNAESIDV